MVSKTVAKRREILARCACDIQIYRGEAAQITMAQAKCCSGHRQPADKLLQHAR